MERLSSRLPCLYPGLRDGRGLDGFNPSLGITMDDRLPNEGISTLVAPKPPGHASSENPDANAGQEPYGVICHNQRLNAGLYECAPGRSFLPAVGVSPAMPAEATLDVWNVIVTKVIEPGALRIAQNAFRNTGTEAGSIVAEWAVLAPDGSVDTMLCAKAISVPSGGRAAMIRVGDDSGDLAFCDIVQRPTGIGPLMVLFNGELPDEISFGFRVYVEGETPPPFPGQDGSDTQAARLTVDTTDVSQGTTLGIERGTLFTAGAGLGGGLLAALAR